MNVQNGAIIFRALCCLCRILQHNLNEQPFLQCILNHLLLRKKKKKKAQSWKDLLLGLIFRPLWLWWEVVIPWPLHEALASLGFKLVVFRRQVEHFSFFRYLGKISRIQRTENHVPVFPSRTTIIIPKGDCFRLPVVRITTGNDKKCHYEAQKLQANRNEWKYPDICRIF